MPPLVCPSPPDCPLYDQRVSYGTDEPLRRAVLTERRRSGLADLIRAEASAVNGTDPRPRPKPKGLPAPSPIDDLPNLDHLNEKGANR